MNWIPKIGETFDSKYQILDSLGSGGNGVVLKALQLDCDRIVALKILQHDAAMDEEYNVRFLREAQSLSKLSNAGIVTIYHLGVSAVGAPYLVMEYVDGCSVRALLNQDDRLELSRSLKIVRDAALAMSYVHQNGIVHRDLKPENILVMKKPEPDTVKVVDFGLAKLIEKADQKLTSTGQLLGTFAYMSPEQCMGKAVDFRSDIYSLSSCLYEMISGTGPFSADNAVGMMYKQINEPVPKLDTKNLGQFHFQLNEFFSKGLHKDPLERFASMEGMADQLSKIIGLVTEDALKSKQLLSPKILVGATCGIISVLICAILLMNANDSHVLVKTSSSNESKSISKQSNQDRIELAFKHNLERSEKGLTKDSPQVLENIDDLADVLLRNGKYEEAEPLLKRLLVARKSKAIPNEHYLFANLLDCCSRLGKYAEAENYGKLLVAQREDSPHGSKTELIAALMQFAQCYLDEGKAAAAEQLCKRVVVMSKNLMGPNDHDSVYSVNLLSTCYQRQGKNAEAIELLEGAMSSWKETGTPLGSDFIGFSDTAAELHRRLGQYAQAALLYKQLLALPETKAADANLIRISRMRALISCYLNQGKYLEAKPLLESVLSAIEHDAKPDKGEIVDTLMNLASCQMASNHAADSYLLLKRALDLGKRTFGPESPRLLPILARLVELDRIQGKTGEKDEVRKTMGTIEQNYLHVDAADPAVPVGGNAESELLMNLGSSSDVFFLNGKFLDAEKSYQKLIGIMEKSSTTPPALLIRRYEQLANCYFVNGKIAESELNYRKALAIRTASFVVDQASSAEILERMARCCEYQGKNVEAEIALKKAVAIREKMISIDIDSFANVLLELADCEIILGKSREAVPLLKRVLSIKSKGNSQGLKSAYNLLRNCYVIEGNKAAMREIDEKTKIIH